MCLFERFLSNLTSKYSKILWMNLKYHLLIYVLRNLWPLPKLIAGTIVRTRVARETFNIRARVFSFECVTLHQCYSARHQLITKLLICSRHHRWALTAWPERIIDTVLCSLSALTQFYIRILRLKHNKDAVLTDSKVGHFLHHWIDEIIIKSFTFNQ